MPSPTQGFSSITKRTPEILYDIYHVFGNDLSLSSTGDLLLCSGEERGKQRLLRRLLTVVGDYIWHPKYGAGLQTFIGEALSSDEFSIIKSRIQSNIFLEESVSKTTPPEIFIQTIQNGLYCQINYVNKATSNPVILTFNVNP